MTVRMTRAKILSAGLLSVLMTAMSVGYADDDDYYRQDRSQRSASDAFEWFTSYMDDDDHRQDHSQQNIVVTLTADPTLLTDRATEPACVALQIGMNLLMDDLNGDEAGGKVKPAKVSLFLTLGGIELAYGPNDFSAIACRTPRGPATASLADLRQSFLDLGGEIVICGLCYCDRHDCSDKNNLPTYGEMADAFKIHGTLMEADKVITFPAVE